MPAINKTTSANTGDTHPQQHTRRKSHSLSLSLKNLFVKTRTEEVHNESESLSPTATGTGVSPMNTDRDELKNGMGFVPLTKPSESFSPVRSAQSTQLSSRNGSVEHPCVTSRKSSVDHVVSRKNSIMSRNNSVNVVEYSDEGTLRVFEDGTHEHTLKQIKIMEKLPAGTGILSGFLRRSSSQGDDAAFSILPEQNRMDFQRRLSIQSRKTFDEEDEDRADNDEDSGSGESDSDADSDADSEEVELQGKQQAQKEQRPMPSSLESFGEAAIGEPQLNLINKLVEKINNNEDPSIMSKNYKLTEKYGKPQGIVGRGTYGIVKLVSKPDLTTKKEIFYAVKELRQKDKEDLRHLSQRLTSEFVISNSLTHLNIVRTIDLMKNSCGVYSEIMEYCPAGDMYSLISKTNREGLHHLESDCFMKQILNGVEYMHSKGVAHCDLKPENILLTTSGVAKISDFGTSAVFRTAWEREVHYSSGACGSEPYVAPEEFICKEYDPRAADVWALGVLYITMVTGTYLWPIAKPGESLYDEYLDGRPRDGKPAIFTPIESMKHGGYFKSRKATIYGMLDPDPRLRLTVKEALNSSWLRNVRLCEAASDYEWH